MFVCERLPVAQCWHNFRGWLLPLATSHEDERELRWTVAQCARLRRWWLTVFANILRKPLAWPKCRYYRIRRFNRLHVHNNYHVLGRKKLKSCQFTLNTHIAPFVLNQTQAYLSTSLAVGAAMLMCCTRAIINSMKHLKFLFNESLHQHAIDLTSLHRLCICWDQDQETYGAHINWLLCHFYQIKVGSSMQRKRLYSARWTVVCSLSKETHFQIIQ